MADSNDYDLVGAEFIHLSLSTPVLVSFRRRDEFHGSQILHLLERIMQSNSQLTLDDNKIKIKFVKVTLPQGEGHHKRQCTNLDKQLKLKRSIIRIKNKDKLCLARALVVAKAILEHMADLTNKTLFRRFQNMCRPDTPKLKLQFNAAKNLMKDAGLEKHEGACGIPELDKLQHVLSDYQIKVFNTQATCGLVYSGPPAPSIIYLYNHDNHYDVITKPPGFFDRSYYCKTCNTTYTNKDKHQCASVCQCCHESPECTTLPFKSLLKCDACNRFFRGAAC